MPKFTYNDVVRVKDDAAVGLRRDRAWIVGIFEDRPGPYFDKFPEGVVYTIEFEDGTSGEVHESNLEAGHLAAKTSCTGG
jgi:hypothetical protein